jgi:hypothetical protein
MILTEDQSEELFLVEDDSGLAGVGVTNVTASLPLHSTEGTTPNLTIDKADTNTDGYLSSADWNTFNNKPSTQPTPGNPDKAVQFNDGGNFGGSANFEWDKTTGVLYVGDATVPHGATLVVSSANNTSDGGIYIRTFGHQVPSSPTGVHVSMRGLHNADHLTGYFVELDTNGARVADVSGLVFTSVFEARELYGIRIIPVNVNTTVDQEAVGAHLDVSGINMDAGGVKLAARFIGAPTNYTGLAADPTQPATAGDLYYNSVSKTFRYYDGTSWQDVGAGTPTAPTTVFGSSCNLTPGVTKYFGLSGFVATPNASPDSNATIPIARAGTLRNMYIRCGLGVAPSMGESITVTIFKNGVSAASITATISDTATTANDLVNTVAVSAGDYIDVQFVTTGGVATAYLQMGIELV